MDPTPDNVPTSSTSAPFHLRMSSSRLRKLRGFVDHVAAVAGQDVRALRSASSLEKACILAVAAEPPGDRPARVVAVREGRRTVAHAVGSRRDAVRVAAGVVSRRSIPVELDGPFAREVAAVTGLRPSTGRRWHRDPALDAEMSDAADGFLRTFGATFVRAAPGAAWTCAVSMTDPASYDADDGLLPPVHWLVVVSTMPVHVVTLAMSARCPHERWGLDEMSAAMAEGVPADGPDRDPPHAGYREAQRVENWCGSVKPWGREVRSRFAHRVAARLEQAAKVAMANLRRSLPEIVQRQAGICGRTFLDLSTASRFLRLRSGWEPVVWERTTETFWSVPALRQFHSDARVVGALSSGSSLARVVAAACRLEDAVHRKTARCFEGAFVGGKADPVLPPTSFGEVVRTLDLVYGADPHRPLFGARDLRVLSELVGMGLPPRVAAGAVVASRGPDGRLVRPPRDLADTYRWTLAKVTEVLSPEDLGPCPSAGTRAVARDLLFPDGRGPAGIAKADATWHARIGMHEVHRTRLLSEIALRDSGQDGDADAVAFPHFLDGPSRVGPVVVTPIKGQEALAVEGHRMSHCVGSYADHAFSGRSMIVGLACRDTRSTGEVALSREDGRLTLRVVQLRSFGNSDPPGSHAEALRAVCAAVDRQARHALAGRIDAACALSAARLGIVEDLSPEDRRRLAELTWDLLSRLAQPGRRRAGLDAWTVHAREVAASVSVTPDERREDALHRHPPAFERADLV